MAQAPQPSPPWGSRSTSIRVEASVMVAAALLLFQLVFGLRRRQSDSTFIQGGLWVAYTMSSFLVAYTLGMMFSSPGDNRMYPFWAVSLLVVSGCANSITAYDLDDNKLWKRQLLDMVQYYFYVLVTIDLLPSDSNNIQMMALGGVLSTIVANNLFRVLSSWMANIPDQSKAVADYMVDQDSSGQRSASSSFSMEGYKYLVQWNGPPLFTHGINVPNYRNKLVGEIITIDMIWAKNYELAFDSDGASQLKDVCLSLALFHLLKRRFFGFYCHEAGRPETRDLVIKGLLSENGNSDDYARAFRIIEVELSFFHDFFFTKYASIHGREFIFFLYSILRTISIVVLGISVYWNLNVQAEIIDGIIMFAILGILVIVDILQIMLYYASDWALVSFACNYVRRGSFDAILLKLITRLRRLRLFKLKYWRNKMGQYSIIKDCCWHVEHQRDSCSNAYGYVEPGFGSDQNQPFDRSNGEEVSSPIFLDAMSKTIWRFFHKSPVKFVILLDIVKREIALSIINSSTIGHLTNGEASLRRNGVLDRFAWTLNQEDRNISHTLLIWHIATNFCEITQPHYFAEEQYREVANQLSSYSAYLMAFLPHLLPGNSTDTKFTIDKVMIEAVVSCNTGEDRLIQRLRSYPQNDTIFYKGLRLARELEGIQDKWKVMAEFWVEMTLYVTPSENVRGHMERLSKGGEFLTHVWALLSHACILKRPYATPMASDGVASSAFANSQAGAQGEILLEARNAVAHSA